MPLKIYQYKKCSTCKKAIKFLEKENIEFKAIDITDKPPSKAELKKMLLIVDGNLRKLFNTSGQVYREMKLGTRLDDMSESEALDLLAKDGKLVKRPFVLSGEEGIVGFREAEWKTFFEN